MTFCFKYFNLITINNSCLFDFADDRPVLSHEPIAPEHRPDHYMCSSSTSNGSNRIRRLLEVSKLQKILETSFTRSPNFFRRINEILIRNILPFFCAILYYDTERIGV